MNHFEEQLNSLLKTKDPAWQNNSRAITKSNVERIANMKNQNTAAWLLESKYGFDAGYEEEPWNLPEEK